MHASIRVLLALILLAGIGPSPVLAQRSKLDDHLQRLADAQNGKSRVDVIVKVRGNGLGQVARKILRRGDKVRGRQPSAGLLAAEVRREDLAALAADPAVESVSVDAPVSAFGAAAASADTEPTVHAAKRKSHRSDGTARADALRQTLGVDGLPYSGSGIGVAIIDSGIQPMVDFGVRITAFRDFTKNDAPDGRAVPAYDDYGHGTHIAGLIGSNGTLSRGEHRGVAPEARLIGLKVLDDRGEGRTSDVIAALDFATRKKAALGIDIVNLSLGHPIYEPAATDPLVQAVERATRAGLVVLVAAGNFGENPETGVVGYAGIMSPGNAPSAITIGALETRGTVARSDDRIPDYSSRGPTWYDALLKPDVVAPGDDLASNVSRSSWLARRYRQLVTKARGGAFIELSGTSMSTGVASGVVALVLEAQRRDDPPATLSANMVKALLQYSALDVKSGGGAYDALTQGAGAINAEGAVRLASAVDAAAPLGSPWMEGFGEPSTTIAGETLPWSQTVYWGDRPLMGPSITVKELAWQGHVVWGTDTFWSTVADFEHIVWGTTVHWLPVVDEHIVWGTGLAFDYSFLGDEHIVWGTDVFWDEHIVWGTSLVGLSFDEHIVWGAAGSPANTVWGSLYDDEHVVWGTQVTAAGLKQED